MTKLVEIYNASRFPEACFVSAQMTSQKFKILIRDEKTYLAVIDDVIAGFISIWPPERFIHHLYILPEFQSQGVAQALIQKCIHHYGKPLSLKSLAANNRACDFYENKGWQCEDTGQGTDGPYRHYWLR
ncbi:MAG: GNAT superfamily N-acetyltransferase [Flavobacterium sp.]|jgi:GNAT superfamily N-acetyltransferase